MTWDFTIDYSSKYAWFCITHAIISF